MKFFTIERTIFILNLKNSELKSNYLQKQSQLGDLYVSIYTFQVYQGVFKYIKVYLYTHVFMLYFGHVKYTFHMYCGLLGELAKQGLGFMVD